MRKAVAATGSAVFFALAPGVVAGVLPWWLTGWHLGTHLWLPLRAIGALLTVLAAGVLLHAFARFVVDGLGTPAPVAPTRHLVVTGLYRHVRNPMYIAVVTAILGQSLLLGRANLVVYAVVAVAVMAAFCRWYEEPALVRQFGAEYGSTPTQPSLVL